jgi:hypothetical protein
MSYPHANSPTLQAKHVEGAKLFAQRSDMVAALRSPMERVAEVGVAYGDFSQVLIEHLQPKQFVAFDLFRFHEIEMTWGRSTKEWLRGMKHLDFYRDRFASYGGSMVFEEGDSHEKLATYPRDYFDLVYLDAGHAYEDVKQDAENAKRALKRDGLLIFNDYIMYDHTHDAPWPSAAYGVVQVANEILINEDWRVFGLALNNHMFCDIAIYRP